MTRALNRVGPRIDPCERPVSVGCSLELNTWRATTMVLFERFSLSHARVLPLKPRVIIDSRIVCG